MSRMEVEERRKRARANAEAALERAMQPQAVVGPFRPEKGHVGLDDWPPRPRMVPQMIWPGLPCTKVSDQFRELLEQRNWSGARVLASSKVPESVFDERTKACLNCWHCAEQESGRLVCGCYTCPNWRPRGDEEAIDLRRRNWYAANVCPDDPPRFWLYEPAKAEAGLT